MRSGRGRRGSHGGQGPIGGRQGGLQRSRSWQGFTSGLRYESVSDAGMPPPPTAPPSVASSVSPSRRPVASSGPPPSKR